MSKRIWDDYLTELDRQVYAKAGFGRKAGFGTRPAILIIDVQYRTTGDRPEPILKAMETYPTACGEAAWAAVAKIQQILEVARPQGVPVLYPIIERQDRFDAGRWKDKIPELAGEIHRVGHRATQVVAEIAPQPGDIVLSKRYASAFFGTPLMTYLNDLDADTVIVTGCTTSGCVRATVADAFSYGFKVAVVEDAVYDRAQVSHAINLWDMQSKYADVVDSAAIIDYLRGIPPRPRRAE